MNRLILTRTKFTDMDGAEDYGFRISDDYGAYFCDKHLLSELPKDDEKLVQMVYSEGHTSDHDDDIAGMIDHHVESSNGITIDQSYYPPEWLREAIKDDRT